MSRPLRDNCLKEQKKKKTQTTPQQLILRGQRGNTEDIKLDKKQIKEKMRERCLECDLRGLWTKLFALS